jgi:hypothetical protein
LRKPHTPDLSDAKRTFAPMHTANLPGDSALGVPWPPPLLLLPRPPVRAATPGTACAPNGRRVLLPQVTLPWLQLLEVVLLWAPYGGRPGT